MPKSVASRLKMTKGGWTGLGWSDLEFSLHSVVTQIGMIPGGVPPQAEPILEVLRKLPALLKSYKAENQVTVIRTAGTRWVYENIW